MFVGSLSACDSAEVADEQISTGEEVDANPEITLQFQQWWEQDLPTDTLEEICQQFTEQTGIHVELISDSYEKTKDAVSAGAAAGTMADLVGMDESMVYDLAKQGTLSNLTELIELNDYDAEQLMIDTQIDGNRYMIPVVSFGYPLYANTDVLHQAGITEIPATWSAFLASCRTVTEKTDAQGCIIQSKELSPVCISESILPWLWASGGRVAEDNQLSLTDNQDAEKTLNYLKNLFEQDYITCSDKTDRDFVTEFLSGNAAFMLPASNCSIIGREYIDQADNIQVIPIPADDDFEDTSGIGVECWAISIAENCEYQKEAMMFIEFLTSPEINKRLSEYGSAFPCNKYAEPDYLQNDGWMRSYYEIYRNSYPVMELAEIPLNEKMCEQFSEQIYKYLNDDMAAEENLLDDMQEQWNSVYQ